MINGCLKRSLLVFMFVTLSLTFFYLNIVMLIEVCFFLVVSNCHWVTICSIANCRTLEHLDLRLPSIEWWCSGFGEFLLEIFNFHVPFDTNFLSSNSFHVLIFISFNIYFLCQKFVTLSVLILDVQLKQSKLSCQRFNRFQLILNSAARSTTKTPKSHLILNNFTGSKLSNVHNTFIHSYIIVIVPYL